MTDGYPSFQMEDGIQALTREQAKLATRDERIRSVRHYIVRRINGFIKTMHAVELANFDHEDLAHELWALLAVKDHLWNPEASSYITFAGFLISHELEEIRNRSRTVQAPHNASSRIKGYERSLAKGSITPQAVATCKAIRSTAVERPELNYSVIPSRIAAPDDSAEKREQAEITRSLVEDCLRVVPGKAAILLRAIYGLSGEAPTTIAKAAQVTGMSHARAKAIVSMAMKQMRSMLTME